MTGMEAVGRLVERLILAVAALSSALLVGVALLTTVSVASRQLTGSPIYGDFEITEIAVGVAVFGFIPYAHLTGSHLVVTLVTDVLPHRAASLLAALNQAVFATVGAVLCWRLLLGGFASGQHGETTMLLRMPLSWGFFFMSFCALLLAASCLCRLFGVLPREGRP